MLTSFSRTFTDTYTLLDQRFHSLDHDASFSPPLFVFGPSIPFDDSVRNQSLLPLLPLFSPIPSRVRLLDPSHRSRFLKPSPSSRSTIRFRCHAISRFIHLSKPPQSFNTLRRFLLARQTPISHSPFTRFTRFISIRNPFYSIPSH